MSEKTNEVMEFEKKVKVAKAIIADAAIRDMYNALVTEYNVLLAAYAKSVKVAAAAMIKAEKAEMKLTAAKEAAKAKKATK